MTLTDGIAGLPPQAATTSPNTIINNPSLSRVSYSFTYTVTSPTTSWRAPTFATPLPLPRCSDTMCPQLNNRQCVDSLGDTYGVLCDTRLSGLVITTAGKKMAVRNEEDVAELEKRALTANFDGCGAYCGNYDRDVCKGMSYERGVCMSYNQITGSFSAPGAIAAVRQ